jgi:hypothetical protein
MMSNYRIHAMSEFRAAGWIDEDGNYIDEMQEAICKHILKLLEVFDGEGHSGSTAPYTINLFSKLAAFEPVVPITGEDWEWNEVEGGVYQNKRCGHVFKQAGSGSCVPITFPYVPKREYVFAPTEEFPNEILEVANQP